MSVKALEWTLGLRNHASGKFLTQETFGFAMNANGKQLKKKQTMTLMSSPDGSVHIRTHMGKYLYGDRDGKIAGDADSPSAATEWTIEPQADGTWALKSACGFYFHGTGEKLTAFVKELPADGKWTVVLAMHPQINLYSVMRKRYVHLQVDELHCNEDVPWGDDALITLVFFDAHAEGRYGLMASNGKYLTASGRLTEGAGADAQFLLGFHDDQISLRDAGGSYLSCVGGHGLLKVNKQRITKDELFVIQDSEPQFTIKSNSQNKQVSVRSGLEVKANQADVTDEERFQMEVAPDGTVSFMTNKLKYWALQDDSSIAAVESKKGAKTGFTVVYQANRVRILCKANDKYVKVKPNGSLMANGDGSADEGVYTMTIINRPELVLRGQYGFMGIKPDSRRITCNAAKGEIFKLTAKDGAYTLSLGGQGWAAEADGVTAKAAAGKEFYLEFIESSKCLIKDAESGMYLEGEQSGGVKATGQGKSINTLWEF